MWHLASRATLRRSTTTTSRSVVPLAFRGGPACVASLGTWASENINSSSSSSPWTAAATLAALGGGSAIASYAAFHTDNNNNNDPASPQQPTFATLFATPAKAYCEAATTFTTTTNKKKKNSNSDDDDTTTTITTTTITTTNKTAAAAVKQQPKKKGQIDVVLGAQWGDEGKGKLVDLLVAGSEQATGTANQQPDGIIHSSNSSGGYDVCARVAGGANAGHTIVVNGTVHKFHLLPSGILCPQTVCLVGNGVVVHLPSLLQELDRLNDNENSAVVVDVTNRFYLSDRAHLVLDLHMQVDAIQERRLGKHSLGTTCKGIGPAYASKISRNGLRVGDLQDWPYFERRYRELVEAHVSQYPELAAVTNESTIVEQLHYYKSIVDRVGAITCDTVALTQSYYEEGKRILVEGANATMLDIDFGTYPFVTSSNPSIGSVLTGLGVAPQTLHGVYGTVKAYCTRVGAGPFPTELDTEENSGPGRHLATVGVEFGTTTGRPRRTGWLDIPQMIYATKINGFTALNLTKLDVLTGLETVKIAIAYKYKDQILTSMPASLTVLDQVEVVYESLPGWTENLSHCRSFADLPPNAQRYVLRCQELIGVPIRWIGVGPGRDDVIDRGDGWDLASDN